MTPPAQPRGRTAKASSGGGGRGGRREGGRPAPGETAAPPPAEAAPPGPGEDGGRLGGEARRAVPGVVADDHAGVARALDRVEQMAGKPGAGGADGRDVDPGRAGAEGTAQARGAEGEAVGEALGQL